MAVIRIDGGCSQIGINRWRYIVGDNEGTHIHEFTFNGVPKLGDSLDTASGVLTPLVGFLINNDPGFQAKRKVEEVWPHGTVDFYKEEK